MSDAKKGGSRLGYGRGKRVTAQQAAPPPGPLPEAASPTEQETPTVLHGCVTGISRGRASATEETPTLGKESSEKSEEEVQKKLAQLTLVELAKRPSFGKSGRPILLEANHFDITNHPATVYQYHVEIKYSPVATIVLTRDDNRKIFWETINNARETVFPNRYTITYDGHHLMFSLNQLKFPNSNTVFQTVTAHVQASRVRQPSAFDVTITLVGPVTVSLHEIRAAILNGSQRLEPMQFLDIVCRQNRSLFGTRMDTAEPGKWFVFGPTTYRAPGGGQLVHLGGGCSMWLGVFTSAHLGQNCNPFLNIDVSHGTFYKEIFVTDFLAEVMDEFYKAPQVQPMPGRQLPQRQLETSEFRHFTFAMKGLRITYTRPSGQKLEYRVSDVSLAASHQKFQGDMGEETIASYFARRYGRLRYPLMPVLKVGSRKQPLFLPIEHCKLLHPQRCTKKLSDGQLRNLIRSTAVPAPLRKQKILDLVRDAKLDNDPWLQNTGFGVQISKDMKKLQGRVLNAPRVEYNPDSRKPIVNPRLGEWRLDDAKVFLSGTRLDHYGVIVQGNRLDDGRIQEFFKELSRVASEMGVSIANRPTLAARIIGEQDIEEKITEFTHILRDNGGVGDQDIKIKFIFVILAGKSYLYSKVKKIAEVMVGIMTQCLQDKTVHTVAQEPGRNRQTSQNISLKINAKMGGVNNRLHPESVWKELMDGRSGTLFIGADVSHPAVGERNMPSVAAVVGNINADATKYSASIRIQRTRTEIMVNVEMMRERLTRFFKESKAKPTRIIYYRDGVGDSQFSEILAKELAHIRGACMALDPEYKPAITMIVVMKRHHTRFFCVDPRDQVGRSCNIPAGTTVDTVITSPQLFDFYLCSHMGIQGTSRPIRYCVLHDDNGFGADDLQALTYALTHLYCRCSRSVSIPAPVYYAHLASFRAKAHIQATLGDFDSDTMSTREGTHAALTESDFEQGTTVMEPIKTTMYFA